jgi:hypothetical protein
VGGSGVYIYINKAVILTMRCTIRTRADRLTASSTFVFLVPSLLGEHRCHYVCVCVCVQGPHEDDDCVFCRRKRKRENKQTNNKKQEAGRIETTKEGDTRREERAYPRHLTMTLTQNSNKQTNSDYLLPFVCVFDDCERESKKKKQNAQKTHARCEGMKNNKEGRRWRKPVVSAKGGALGRERRPVITPLHRCVSIRYLEGRKERER